MKIWNSFFVERCGKHLNGVLFFKLIFREFLGEDELSCNHGCSGGQWSCRNGDCIAMSRYCDGVADCGDGTVSLGTI